MFIRKLASQLQIPSVKSFYHFMLSFNIYIIQNLNRVLSKFCMNENQQKHVHDFAENFLMRGPEWSVVRRSESCVWGKTFQKLSKDISNGL